MMIRRVAAVLVRAAGAVLVAFLALLLVPQPASACDVSYHYKPSFSLDQPRLGGGKVCSTSTSLAGATMVALLAASALAGAGVVAFRRGEQTARSLGGPADALSGYLGIAGLGAAASRSPDETGEQGAHTSP